MAETLQAELLVDCRNTLGEGIQWNRHDERLYWTDIEERRVWSANAHGEAVDQWTFPERVGAFAFDRNGDLLLALETGLHAFTVATQDLRRLTKFEVDMPTTRMNDGRCDRDGRFIVGGMDEAALGPLSSVVRFAPEGIQETLISDVGCTNSICFSPDGTAMYFRRYACERYPALSLQSGGRQHRIARAVCRPGRSRGLAGRVLRRCGRMCLECPMGWRPDTVFYAGGGTIDPGRPAGLERDLLLLRRAGPGPALHYDGA